MEIDQGDWEGKLRSEIAARDPERHRLWHSRPWETSPPNGERLEQVRDRVYAGIDELLARHPDETIGLVAHRTPIALLKMRWQDLDPNRVRSIEMSNTYFESVRVPGSSV
jgi:broad specificity phosphatase PhoE